MKDTNNKLLTRDAFREGCLKRDNYKCLFCDCKDNLSVHHIIERRLWPDEGYYFSNGATLCTQHHVLAEQTVLSVEEICEKIGVKKPLYPEHLYDGCRYDKWANEILSNGMRVRGELFYDDSVQKILEPVIHLFTKYVKYPRTLHLPFSASLLAGLSPEDRSHKNLNHFEGKRIILMLKMDGENTTILNDHFHARSVDSQNDFTRHWVANFHQRIKYLIPDGWRICAENLWARHTVPYEDEMYIDGHYNPLRPFSIWNEKNECLAWDETVEWFRLFEESMRSDETDENKKNSIFFRSPKVEYDGIFDMDMLKSFYKDRKYDPEKVEGFVIRVADSFHYKEFSKWVGKYVTKEFKEKLNNSHGHWRKFGIQKNG